MVRRSANAWSVIELFFSRPCQRLEMQNPFRYFNSSPEIIRLTVMMYVRFPLSLRQVEDLLFERGIDICHATVRYWWNRFGPLFSAEIRKRRVHLHWYSCSAPGSLDTSLSHAAGLIEIAACHA